MANYTGGAAMGEKKFLVKELQKWFDLGSKPDQATRQKIASCLGLSQKQVANWFQNKRAREKAKTLEKDHQLLVQELEIAKAENNLLRAKIEDFKSQVMVERQRIQMNQSAAAAAEAEVAPAHPHPQHLFQGSVSGHAVAGDQVPGQTTFWAWPDQHNFR